MEMIKRRLEFTCKSLESLRRVIETYQKSMNSDISTDLIKIFGNKNELILSIRDAMIKRFKLAVDLFWKFFKVYLEEKEKSFPETNTPRAIFRAMCNARLATEKEAEALLQMVGNRNKTSHIYMEEISDFIAKLIPSYYELMCKKVSHLKV